MSGATAARTAPLRLVSHRRRRILIAILLTLLTAGSLLGLIGLIRWRGAHALEVDTGTAVAQTTRQLVRALESRRGTLTFLRDTLNRQADLTPAQRQALGASATEHTRHLLGTGLIREGAPPVWWSGPRQVTGRELAHLNTALVRRVQVPGIWRVPSTFMERTDGTRPLLIMLDPLSSPASRRTAIIGVFDLAPLLEDFFISRLTLRHPAQVLDGDTVLYRTNDWQPVAEQQGPFVAESPLTMDAARWTLQMQPGSTRVMQTLSWFHILLVGLSVIAGLGVTIIVWILAARTWILQRAVRRRTAALRRVSERLRRLATTDELTGLHNRRFFLERWGMECKRAGRYGRPLACLMIDVNGFKQVNDRYGHQVGDLVLKQVAQELRVQFREFDTLARFGGDEFVVALPETSEAQAALVAEKLRALRLPRSDSPECRGPRVTLAVGIAHGHGQRDPAQILLAADQSLYAQKRREKRQLKTPLGRQDVRRVIAAHR